MGGSHLGGLGEEVLGCMEGMGGKRLGSPGSGVEGTVAVAVTSMVTGVVVCAAMVAVMDTALIARMVMDMAMEIVMI